MNKIEHFNLPPCIKEVIFEKEEPENYEAFLYHCVPIGDIEGLKNYGGFHTGYVGDGYWDSSTDDEFARLSSTITDGWNLIIKDFGTTDDMRFVEWEFLKKYKAATNSEWYNKWYGFKPKTGLDKDKCRELIRRIKTDEFNSPERPVTELIELERIQARHKDQDKAQKEIASDVDDNKGSNKNADSILIFGKWKEGKDVVVDGNTTIQGFHRSKHGKKSSLKNKVVPYSIGKYFSRVEALWIGNELNPKSKKVSTPRGNKDASKFLFELRKDENIPIRSKSNRKILVDWQYTNGQINTILSNAEKMWDEYETSQSGQFCNWKAEPYKSELDKKIKKKMEDPETIAYSFSAEAPSPVMHRILLQLVPQLTRDRKTKVLETPVKNIHLYVYFNSKRIRKDWLATEQLIYKYCEFLFEQDKKIEVTIEHLPLNEEN